MNHQHYMTLALEEARQGGTQAEVPIGVVVVYQDKVLAKAYNQVVKTKHPLAHAEMLALEETINHITAYERPQATLYVTLEPCPMCLGAILQARIGTLVFGAYNVKWGSCGTVVDIGQKYPTKLEVIGGVCADDCSQVLKEFFKFLRE